MLALNDVNTTALVQGARRAVDALPPVFRNSLLGLLHLLATAAALAVIVPLRGLYLNGPTLGGYGFWGGAEPADICAQLTGISAVVWIASPTQALQCEALLERKFAAFAWTIFIVTYLTALGHILYSLFTSWWERCCTLRRPSVKYDPHPFSGYDLGYDLRRDWRREVHDEVRHLFLRDSPSHAQRRHLVWRTPTPPRARSKAAVGAKEDKDTDAREESKLAR